MQLTPLILAQPQKTVYSKSLPYLISHLASATLFCDSIVSRFQGRHKCYIHPKSKFIYRETGSYADCVWGTRLGKLNEDYVEDPETLIPTVLQELAKMEADLQEALRYIQAKRLTIVDEIRSTIKDGLDKEEAK